MKEKQKWSERINARFREAPGEIFKDGKWRFWFALVFGLAVGSAIGTALIFGGSVGTLAVGMGVIVLWTLVGTLYYSDSEDARLSRGVSLLDSVALVFVVGHFCFVMWVYGHLITLRGAEGKYEAQATAYNERQEKIQADNVKIAEAGIAAEKERVKRARLENDTAYWTAKIGRAARSSAKAEIAPTSLSTAPIELEKPKAPEESSAAFLSKWDAWIRAANFGELILAAITLIYIRNRSARFNAQGAPERVFPVATLSHKGLAPKAAVYVHSSRKTTPVATGGRGKAAEALRDHLRVISSGMLNRSFKVDLRKPEEGGGVWIRLYESREGKEKMIAKTKQSDKLLAAVNREDFRAKLIAELIACGFPIGGER
jgi:hypothetical protein